MPGWNKQKIIDQVDKRTEGRASEKLDMNAEFYQALDEFCEEKHYWWRRRRLSFTTTIGVQKYDLTKADGAGNLGDIEIESVVLLDPTCTKRQHELIPINDSVGQLVAASNTVPDTPSSFFIDTNESLTTLRLGSPANVAQLILVEHWAVSAIGDDEDDAEDDIPLVPPRLHWGMVYALGRRVFEFLYGQQDPRWQVMEKRYQDFLLKAARYNNWTTQVAQSASVGRGTGVRATTTRVRSCR